MILKKSVYQSFKNYRCGNLREHISSMVKKEPYVLTEEDEIMLIQLREYLKVLQQEKEAKKSEPEKVVKNRKRKVKSKKRK